MTAITVDGLTKEFGDVTAVNGLSFAVDSGEIFGLLGPNGAGKSTLIKMLVTLLQPSSGTATVNGYDIREQRGHVRDSLGIVFQEPALDEELTGEENLSLHARMYGQRKRERQRRIDDILELVDLREDRDVLVENYSGGMKRRLEIGRGLLHEPAVLFLDEPTVGLDARARREMWDYIQRLNDQSGISIVLTTHYIEEAEHLCDRVAIVDEGEIVALDTPAALKASLGGDVVTLEVEGSADPLRRKLEGKSWIAEVADTDAGVHVTSETGDAHVADLVRLADAADVHLASIDHRRPNLESVFLSVTGSTFDERESDERERVERDHGESDERDIDESDERNHGDETALDNRSVGTNSSSSPAENRSANSSSSPAEDQ